MRTAQFDTVESLEADLAPDTPAATPQASQPRRIGGVITGILIAFKDEGQTPLVLYPGQPGRAAIEAASTVDLYGTHIGRQVALMFERGDPRRPMVIGLLRNRHSWPLASQPAQVEVGADGERLIVSAREELVLRCGAASITLTHAGKVLISGAYISSEATGTHRVKGGTVQIN